MKLLVVINNHNSLGTLEFCTGLKRFDSGISVIAACSPAIAKTHAGLFARLGVRAFIITPGGTLTPVQPEHQAGPQCQSPAAAKSRLRRAAPFLPFYGFAREQLIYRRIGQCRELARALFAAEQPDIVISISDRSHDYVESAILWTARQQDIPIVVPFAAHYDIDSALVYRRDTNGQIDPELRPFWPPSPYKWLTWLRLRGQLYKGVFFQPAYLLNAHRRAGTLSAYPWWVGNGLSDIVCVDSRYTADKYAGHRVDPQKIHVTGHVAYDRVFESFVRRESLRAELTEKYHLDPAKPLLIFSMPQYAEQGYMDWKEHWTEIETIMAAVASAKPNMVISLHPRSDARKYAYLEDKYQSSIANEPLADMIGAADLFIASNSSTFAWAALCGIPAIAVKSPIHLLFDFLDNVRPAYDSTMIAAGIGAALASKHDFTRDWKTLSREEVFDGQFNQRFLTLLKNARATSP